ncbi:MAG: hypothetical protein A2075_00880 [Geobacteraceae bacterium GWC2_58_44]|nr:MAG: hypothetical protein A2075_00880 [Geobacteraceae bacterium GWC2_58_44]HBG04870.1 fibronectin type III domain-containing protein [Geobacter sp.]
MFAVEIFLMNFAKMGYTELIPWLLDTATLQEAHPFHRANWPDWVPGASKFREHAEILSVAVKAAENKDREKTKERDQKHADTLLSVNLNANYIVMRWHHEKNESLLHNAGYVLKEKTKKSYGRSSISNRPLDLKLKNGPDPGSVTVKFEKDPAAGLYQLQICKGVPVGEESWGEQGLHKSCRFVVIDLDRASWYYFRGRSHGDNETSPWSAPVGIVVV